MMTHDRQPKPLLSAYDNDTIELQIELNAVRQSIVYYNFYDETERVAKLKAEEIVLVHELTKRGKLDEQQKPIK